MGLADHQAALHAYTDPHHDNNDYGSEEMVKQEHEVEEEKKEDDKDNNNNDIVPRPHYNIIFSPRRTSASYSMDTIKVTSSCGVSLLEKVPIPYVLN